MDKAALIDALWGGSGDQTPPAGGDGLPGGAQPPAGGPGEQEGNSDAAPQHKPGAGLYRENLEGSPPTTYEPVLNNFFSGREYQARFDKDELRTEALHAARTGANEVLQVFEVGEHGAREIFNLFGDYIERPDSDEVKESKAAEAAAVLSKEWGHDTEKMLGAAKKVLAEASRKIPNLMETVERTGIGNDVVFIRRLAHIGKRLGFTK